MIGGPSFKTLQQIRTTLISSDHGKKGREARDFQEFAVGKLYSPRPSVAAVIQSEMSRQH
jgi:hypothetical protein